MLPAFRIDVTLAPNQQCDNHRDNHRDTRNGVDQMVCIEGSRFGLVMCKMKIDSSENYYFHCSLVVSSSGSATFCCHSLLSIIASQCSVPSRPTSYTRRYSLRYKASIDKASLSWDWELSRQRAKVLELATQTILRTRCSGARQEPMGLIGKASFTATKTSSRIHCCISSS
jgi:hypothetical protein